MVVLEDVDLETLAKGEMVKVEIGEGNVIGLVTTKFLEEQEGTDGYGKLV